MGLKRRFHRSPGGGHPALVEAYKVAWRDKKISSGYVLENLVPILTENELSVFFDTLEVCGMEVEMDDVRTVSEENPSRGNGKVEEAAEVVERCVLEDLGEEIVLPSRIDELLRRRKELQIEIRELESKIADELLVYSRSSPNVQQRAT